MTMKTLLAGVKRSTSKRTHASANRPQLIKSLMWPLYRAYLVAGFLQGEKSKGESEKAQVGRGQDISGLFKLDGDMSI